MTFLGLESPPDELSARSLQSVGRMRPGNARGVKRWQHLRTATKLMGTAGVFKSSQDRAREKRRKEAAKERREKQGLVGKSKKEVARLKKMQAMTGMLEEYRLNAVMDTQDWKDWTAHELIPRLRILYPADPLWPPGTVSGYSAEDLNKRNNNNNNNQSDNDGYLWASGGGYGNDNENLRSNDPMAEMQKVGIPPATATSTNRRHGPGTGSMGVSSHVFGSSGGLYGTAGDGWYGTLDQSQTHQLSGEGQLVIMPPLLDEISGLPLRFKLTASEEDDKVTGSRGPVMGSFEFQEQKEREREQEKQQEQEDSLLLFSNRKTSTEKDSDGGPHGTKKKELVPSRSAITRFFALDWQGETTSGASSEVEVVPPQQLFIGKATVGTMCRGFRDTGKYAMDMFALEEGAGFDPAGITTFAGERGGWGDIGSQTMKIYNETADWKIYQQKS